MNNTPIENSIKEEKNLLFDTLFLGEQIEVDPGLIDTALRAGATGLQIESQSEAIFDGVAPDSILDLVENDSK